MFAVLSSRIMVRTTIDLDASVLRELKERQRRDGKSLGRLASELLARALRQDVTLEAEDPPFDWTAQVMGARVDLDDTEAVQRLLDHE